MSAAVVNTSDDASGAIEAAVAKLAESSQKMGAAMYAAGQTEAPAGDFSEDAADADGDVVDAEIVDDEGDQK